MANHKAYYEKHHPATQMSWPCALALREHDIHTPSTALYDEGYTENQIFDTQGNQLNIRPAANLHGKICNGLKSLPKEIGNLKKLEIRRHVAAESESAQVQTRYAAVVVELHARLGAPQVGVFVEVPVGSRVVAFARIGPARAVEGFPDGFQCVVVLDIFVAFVERDFGFDFGRFVVFHREVRRGRPGVRLKGGLVLVVGHIRDYAVFARRQRQQRVAFARRGLVAERAVCFVLFVEVDGKFHRQFLERRQVVRFGVLYRQVRVFDFVERVLAVYVAGAGPDKVRHVFQQRDAYFAARRHVHRQVVGRQSARCHGQFVLLRQAVVEQFVVLVIERERHYTVVSRQ